MNSMETPVDNAKATVTASTTTPSAPANQAPTASVPLVAGSAVTADAGQAPKDAPVTKHRAARTKKASAKKVVKAAPKKKAAAKIVKSAKAKKGPKKSDIVRELMSDKANRKLPRKEQLALVAKKAKLSPAAANTYLYKYRPQA